MLQNVQLNVDKSTFCHAASVVDKPVSAVAVAAVSSAEICALLITDVQFALVDVCSHKTTLNVDIYIASLVRHSLLHFLLSQMAVHHLHHLHYHRLHHLLLA